MPPYNAIVEDHFARPRNLGALPDANCEAEASNPVCGDRMRLFLRVDGDRVTAASFLAQGCPAAIAAASMTTVLLTGATLDEARRLTNQAIADALGGLPRAKLHCSVLAEEVIASALASGGASRSS